MIWSHIILALGWILFCSLHSVFASLKFKQLAERRMNSQYRFYRLYYTLFSFASFGLIILYQVSISSFQVFAPNMISLTTGILITLFGLVIMCICIAKYFMQLSGLKGLIENRTTNKLMKSGIHNYVRHPLYAGTFIFIWGLFIVLPYLSLLIAVSIITIYTLIGLKWEEKKLEREFGEAYRMYKQQVPMIFPRFTAKANQPLSRHSL